LGPIAWGPMWEMTDWGRSVNQPSEISDNMKSKVDSEVKKIVDEAYKVAVALLKKNRKKMDKLVDRLMEKETVEQEEFDEVMGEPKAALAFAEE